LPLLQDVLEARERVLGVDDPDTHRSAEVFTLCLQAQGGVAAVLPLYRETLARREMSLGNDHPRTFDSVHTLACRNVSTTLIHPGSEFKLC